LEASVVIPTLGEEGSIGACLRALRAQDVPVEIIVVDGGSKDRTVEIAREFADIVIEAPGTKIGEARQIGAEAAGGGIIVTTDADSVPPPGWLEKLLRHFSDPNVVAVGGPVRALNPGVVQNLYASGLSAATNMGLFVGFNMAYRKDPMLAAGGYANVKQGEDWELATRLRRYGRLVFDPEAYVYTDVPFNRQLEFAAIATNAGILTIGIATNTPMVIGLGSGYFLSTVGTAMDKIPDDIHHSQIAVAGLALTTAFHGAMSPYAYQFLVGLFTGILEHHFITEDVFDPVWLRINGAFQLGVILILAST